MISYFVYITAGLSALLVSTVFFSFPPPLKIGESKGSDGIRPQFPDPFKDWFLDSYYSFSSYVQMMLLGNAPDLHIKLGHRIDDNGFHRNYQLRLGCKQSSTSNIPWDSCQIEVTWQMPKEAIIDVWSLNRSAQIAQTSSRLDSTDSAKVEWMLAGRDNHPIDIEVPSYDPKATIFMLRAVLTNLKANHGVNWERSLNIPNLILRYQLPNNSGVSIEHAKICLPQVNLVCRGDAPFAISTRIDRNNQYTSRPIELSVPVAKPSMLPAQITLSSLGVCLGAILVALVKY